MSVPNLKEYYTRTLTEFLTYVIRITRQRPKYYQIYPEWKSDTLLLSLTPSIKVRLTF